MKYNPIEIKSGSSDIKIWGISEGVRSRLQKLVYKVDPEMTVREYCKNVLRNYTFKSNVSCEGCSLKSKLLSIKEKIDPDMSLSSLCKGIILDHLKEMEKGN